MEKDKSRLAELTKQYSDHEEVLLENLYHSKKKFEKISEEKQVSLDRWKSCVKVKWKFIFTHFKMVWLI